MRTFQQRVILITVMLSLICAVQVSSLPFPEDWKLLLQRTKRSLLWRWNSMKPVGASCREHSECGTKYCRKNLCSFHN
ncbi:liver-expressed antimicrobial peptide 2-like [Antennarius striatus]|uniref:liver-expressed antimicrobial peptide 2-like n=1 Tax=Antennarius striatus TaxID=241820 RepID=UPI0035AF58F0